MDHAAVETIVDAWCARDHGRAFNGQDHDVIDATRTVRSLVIELLLVGETRDLYQACATLGRVVAERGGSASLAASTMDGAEGALGAHVASEEVLGAARAAMAEGYEAATRDLARKESARAWEYPRCAVPLDAETAAIVAGFPEDDDDALIAWAGRAAQAMSRAGLRRAVVSGTPKARRALTEALEVAGIAIHDRYPRAADPPAPPPKADRLRWLPWRRSAG
jgi:hypothetical protein